jgi:DNA-binding NarL/FixJ family response regulator
VCGNALSGFHGNSPCDTNAEVSAQVVRVLVCDDEPLVREGLKAALQQPSIEVVGDIARHCLSVEEAKRTDADVVLMGGGGCPAGTEDFSQVMPEAAEDIDCPLAIVIEPTDRRLFVSCVQAGIRGFISRRTALAEASDAVVSMARNQAYLSPALARHHLDWFATRLRRDAIGVNSPAGRLSPRETEVLKMLGDGLPNTKIARALQIREVTVRSHVYNILNKLNLRSRTDAALYAFQMNMDSE